MAATATCSARWPSTPLRLPSMSAAGPSLAASSDADASMLSVTAFNAGMIAEDSFKRSQGPKVNTLARWVIEWLEGPYGAVVGLNEIHQTIAEKLLVELRGSAPFMRIDSAVLQTNCLIWRAPQFCLPCLPPACPASCWCLDAQRAAGRTCTAKQATRAQQTRAHMRIT